MDDRSRECGPKWQGKRTALWRTVLFCADKGCRGESCGKHGLARRSNGEVGSRYLSQAALDEEWIGCTVAIQSMGRGIAHGWYGLLALCTAPMSVRRQIALRTNVVVFHGIESVEACFLAAPTLAPFAFGLVAVH